MKGISYILLLLLLLPLVFSSCKKVEVEDDFLISLIETTPSAIIEFEENIKIRIEYSHNQGFLGFSDPDYLSLEVKDSRLSEPDYYHLVPLSPPQSDLSISGEILIQVDAPFIFGNGNIETLTFTIAIQDKDKNWSNKVVTELITVNRASCDYDSRNGCDDSVTALGQYIAEGSFVAVSDTTFFQENNKTELNILPNYVSNILTFHVLYSLGHVYDVFKKLVQ
jgi:hypothetical protein